MIQGVPNTPVAEAGPTHSVEIHSCISCLVVQVEIRFVLPCMFAVARIVHVVQSVVHVYSESRN